MRNVRVAKKVLSGLGAYNSLARIKSDLSTACEAQRSHVYSMSVRSDVDFFFSFALFIVAPCIVIFPTRNIARVEFAR